jgi:hypothetical protein
LEKGLQYLSGDAGRELLLAMHLAGVRRLVVEGVWMKGLVEEITGNQPIDAPMGQSRKKESSHRPMFREQEKSCWRPRAFQF